MKNLHPYKQILLLSILFIFFGGSCTGGSSGNGGSSTFTTPTILYYQFEGTGFKTLDSSGNGIEATIVGCSRVPGKVGNGLEILPAGYVWYENGWYQNSANVPGGMDAPFMSTGEVSIETWIKMSTAQAGQTYHIFGGGYDGIRFQVNDTKLEFLYGSYPNWTPVIAGNSSLVADTWYYVAVTYDSSDAYIFINGVEDNHANVIYSFPHWNNRWYIGNQHSTGSGSNGFPGVIDELRLSNVALREADITDYYNATK
jgi:hypothetical protein